MTIRIPWRSDSSLISVIPSTFFSLTSSAIFSIKRAWQGFWRNALMSLAATLTMVLMLTLLSGFFILQNVLLASLSFVEQKVEVVAYVQNTATQEQIDTLVAKNILSAAIVALG